MDNATSILEDYPSCSSDKESLDGIDTDEAISQPVSCRAKVVTKESLLAAQRKELGRVMEKLSLKEHHARTLLIHCRWDVEKLFALLVEKGKNRLFSGVGLTVLENQLRDRSSMMSCDVCTEDVPGHQITQMDCGHSFCNNCWARHFAVKINEGQSKRIICMAHQCNAICDDDVVRTLVSKSQPDLAEKFDRFLLESYVKDNKMVKWCPSTPHCGNAIRIEEDVHCEVECSCGLQFCFSCSSEAHSPCSCVMWELWRKKFADESETDSWMAAHTKQCPKCHTPVENIDGSTFMTCFCGQPFCWLCGGATGKEHTWFSREGHSCGQYQEDKEKLRRASCDPTLYFHYQSCYRKHIDSFKLEDILSDRIREKVSILEKREFKLKDFSSVTDALYRLFRSRRIIAYSYAFAFYMIGVLLRDEIRSTTEGKMKRNVFEDLQEELDEKVVELSHDINKFLDEPFDHIFSYAESKAMGTRYKIVNLSAEADTLCKKMYKSIDVLLAIIPQLGDHHNIAPYRSNGIERATVSDCGTSGGTSSRLDQASGSGSSEDPTSSSNKRPRIQ